MQFNNFFKHVVILLPIAVLTACAASDSSDSTASEVSGVSRATNDSANTVSTPMSSESTYTEEELIASVDTKVIYFGFDKFAITSEFEGVLSAHADHLKKNKSQKIAIEGHTDEKGTPEYNIALGERRAVAASNYLEAMGVNSSQISIVSYGEEKRADRGQGSKADAKNRRAVVVYK